MHYVHLIGHQTLIKCCFILLSKLGTFWVWLSTSYLEKDIHVQYSQGISLGGKQKFQVEGKPYGNDPNRINSHFAVMRILLAVMRNNYVSKLKKVRQNFFPLLYGRPEAAQCVFKICLK